MKPNHSEIDIHVGVESRPAQSRWGKEKLARFMRLIKEISLIALVLMLCADWAWHFHLALCCFIIMLAAAWLQASLDPGTTRHIDPRN